MVRHVLVTGSSSGIGRATALLLDRAGSESMEPMLERAIGELPDTGRSGYEATMRGFVEAMSASELKGSPPEVVAAAVHRALTERSPKTRYPAGDRARTLAWLGRLLPNPALDRVRAKLFGG